MSDLPINSGTTMVFKRYGGPKRAECDCDKKRHKMTEQELKNLYNTRLHHWIKWNPCEIKPKEGEEVWVLCWHNKGHFPSSFQICAGEVETGNNGSWRVNTCDYDGSGCHCYYPNDYDRGFNFWCSKWEISVPEEVIRWDHMPGVM